MSGGGIDDLMVKVAARRRLPPAACRRDRRVTAGLSQQDVADAFDPPVTHAAVSRWESGEREPTGERLIQYVLILDAIGEIGVIDSHRELGKVADVVARKSEPPKRRASKVVALVVIECGKCRTELDVWGGSRKVTLKRHGWRRVPPVERWSVADGRWLPHDEMSSFPDFDLCPRCLIGWDRERSAVQGPLIPRREGVADS